MKPATIAREVENCDLSLSRAGVYLTDDSQFMAILLAFDMFAGSAP